jgi:ribosomal protein S21
MSFRNDMSPGMIVWVGAESLDAALRRLKKLREQAGVAHSERRHLYARSRGERRRVMIARARKRRLSDVAPRCATRGERG